MELTDDRKQGFAPLFEVVIVHVDAFTGRIGSTQVELAFDHFVFGLIDVDGVGGLSLKGGGKDQAADDGTCFIHWLISLECSKAPMW
ncbi:MAG: hypothetical protein BWY72_00445 [Bacteroidetes bacterium ADurb.Bin416]|nr:MAG: hypothetical protein BWY72_00445 [Bacteroidetes bacterium ADurb.Bin416]